MRKLAQRSAIILALLLSLSSISLQRTVTAVSSASLNGSSAIQSLTAEFRAQGLPILREGLSPDVFASTTSTNVAMITGFKGLNFTQSGCSSQCAADDTVAAGPNHVVEMVNTAIGIFDKQGVLKSISSFYSFFKETNTRNFFSDPAVLYDAPSGRWFASAIDGGLTDSIKFAVSATNDPTGTWKVYSQESTLNSDQPKLGVSDDKVVVTSTFDGDFWVYSKSDLLSGLASPRSQFFSLTGTYPVPVQSLSSTKTEYMVSLDNSTTIKLFSLTQLPPNVKRSSVSLTIAPTSRPPHASYPGCNNCSNGLVTSGGENKVVDAVWSNGRLWLGLNTGCTPNGDSERSCARLIQIDTTSPAVLQDFDLGAIGYDYFYPALRVDGAGNLDVILGISSYSNSTCCFPSLVITGQAVGDPIDSVARPLIILSGTGLPGTTGWFGDYFGAGVDPSDPSRVWITGEYCPSDCGWASYIASMSVGSGGGSVAAGTLVTLADGSQIPVQNLLIGMQLLSYDMVTRHYVVTTLTKFVSVVTNNLMIIQTTSGKPLIVDQNPVQKVYTMLPDGVWTLLSVTELKVGYFLFDAIAQTWVQITEIQFETGGQHVMYDIYNTAPGNYIADGYLDPHKN